MFETTDHQQEIRTNLLGTVNFEEDFHRYRYRVFALGDFFTQGTGLPSDCSYPFQLAHVEPEESGAPLRVATVSARLRRRELRLGRIRDASVGTCPPGVLQAHFQARPGTLSGKRQ
jgi:hypothetical protein